MYKPIKKCITELNIYIKKNKVFFFLILIAVIISVGLILNKNFENFENNEFKFYNENNELIDHKSLEVTEQEQAKKYIDENDKVLELGARYGTVSCLVNSKLKNKTDHYVVEPDKNVWSSLEKNKKINNSEFTIIKGVIGKKNTKIEEDGYSSRTVPSDNPGIELYSIPDVKFNTLIVDCEGCFENFYNENKDFVKGLNKIMYETDFADKCDYNYIKNELLSEGFKVVENNNNFHYVLIK